MVKVYVRQGCPYCNKVKSFVQERGYEVDFIDAPPGSKNRAQMVAIGKKEMVPFLVDGDISMYESDDIIGYLETKFG